MFVSVWVVTISFCMKGLFFLLIILGANLFILCNGPYITENVDDENNEIDVDQTSMAREYSSKVTTFDYDVRISRCDIDGSVVIRKSSNVLMNDVSILVDDEAYIAIYDNASLCINGSTIDFGSWGAILYIYIYNNSHLSLEFTEDAGGGSVFIYAYDEAVVEVSNSRLNGILTASENSSVYVHGYMYYLGYKAYGYASIFVEDSDIYSGDISLYTSSRLSVSSSNTSDINAYDNSSISIYNASIDDVYAYGNTTTYIEDSNVDTAIFYDGSYFYISGGNYNMIMATWAQGQVPLRYPGARGIVENTNVLDLYLYSGTISTIRNTSINQLYYRNVYSGNFTLNQSGEYYGAKQKNYINESSTANIIDLDEYTYIIVNSTVARIKDISTQLSVYIYNVSTLSILNSVVTDLYAWYSGVFYYNSSSLQYLKVYSYNSSISLVWLDIQEQLEVRANKQDVFLNHITSSPIFSFSELNLYSIYAMMEYVSIDNIIINLYNCSGYIYGCSFSYANVRLKQYSAMMINYSYIDGYLSTHDSYVALYNTTIDELYCDKLEVRDGYFEYLMGTVVGHGNIRYGVENLGNVTIISRYDLVRAYLYNSTLNITSPTYAPFSYSATYFYLYQGSALFAINLTTPLTAPGLLANNSIVNITNGELSNANMYGGGLFINNTTVSSIYIENGFVTAYSSRIISINVLNSSIEIYGSNVTKGIYTSLPPEHGVAEYISYPPLAYIYANDSEIHEIVLIGNGSIRLENSELYGLYYMLHNVYLIDTNITGYAVRGYMITQGDVIVSNNVVPTGSYRELLHMIGSSYIANELPVIVGYRTSGILRITIENSSLYEFIMYGGSAIINNSELVMLYADMEDMGIYNTIINWTDIKVGIALICSSISMSNVSMYGDFLYMRGSSISVSETLLDADYVLIQNASIMLNQTYTHIPDMLINMQWCSGSMYRSNITGIFMSDSTLAIHDSNITYVGVEDSLLFTYDSIFSDAIVLHNGSSIYADNITIYAFCVYTSTYTISYTPLYVEGIVKNSNITTVYMPYYNVTSYLGTIFDNETMRGEYDRYIDLENTTISSIINRCMFDIHDYARANISNYSSSKCIVALWINIMRDLNPPNITRLNGTDISYEEPEKPILCFRLNDETPTFYKVLIDGGLVDSGNYTANYILRINLSEYVSSFGDHILDVYAYDSVGQYSYVSTGVHLYPLEPPEIVSYPNDTYTINMGESIELVWVAIDVSPATYIIMVNDGVEKNGTWTSGVDVRYTFKGETKGDFNITIIFHDKYGLYVSNTVIVSVVKPSSKLYGILIILAIIIISLILVTTLKRKSKKRRHA